MTLPDSPRVLLLPGWLDSGPGHWQTLWEQQHGDTRVQQADWLWPRRGDWMARLEEVLLEDERPALLAAHSLGCHLVAAWAAHSRHTKRVLGALLVAPPDLDRPDIPIQLRGWRPAVLGPLPFPARLSTAKTIRSQLPNPLGIWRANGERGPTLSARMGMSTGRRAWAAGLKVGPFFSPLRRSRLGVWLACRTAVTWGRSLSEQNAKCNGIFLPSHWR